MAGDWIKMRTNLDSDPRVMRMADAMGITTAQVVGHLFQLWSWADQHTKNGNASSVTDVTLLKRICNGAPSQWCVQLQNCGWLRVDENGISIPHFEEHNGQTAKTRALTQARVKRFRNADNVTDVTLKRYQRREEKRRVQEPLPLTPSPVIPAALDTPTFRATWTEWQVYRKPMGGCKNWDALWGRQLDMLTQFGPDGAVRSLQQSMVSGWKGLFEPRQPNDPVDRKKVESQKAAQAALIRDIRSI
jgi:hypothetical protein